MREATLAGDADECDDPVVVTDLLSPCCGGVRCEGSDMELLDDDRGARDGLPSDTKVVRATGTAVSVLEFDVVVDVLVRPDGFSLRC